MSGRTGRSGPDLLGALAAGLDPTAVGPRHGDAAPEDAGSDTPSSAPRAAAAGAPGAEATAADGAPRCSRRGCTEPAEWALEWNNPRVHAPERIKTWIACPEHRAPLADFLASRGFLRHARPLAVAAHPSADPAESTRKDPA